MASSEKLFNRLYCSAVIFRGAQSNIHLQDFYVTKLSVLHMWLPLISLLDLRHLETAVRCVSLSFILLQQAPHTNKIGGVQRASVLERSRSVLRAFSSNGSARERLTQLQGGDLWQ